MTFDQLVADICTRLNLNSTEATTRVGKGINEHHRSILATLGLDPLHYVTRTATTALDSDKVTFTQIEKLDRVFERGSDGIVRVLEPVLLPQLREGQTIQGSRQCYAVWSQDATSITILLPGLALAVTSLYADGWATLVDLTGSDVPAIPASFHHILTNRVMSDEYLRKEKTQLADRYGALAETGLRELRFHLADAPPVDFRQGNHVIGGAGGGGTGGSGSSVITGDIVFDRDPGPPFHVTPGSGKVDNLDADLLDSKDSTFFQNASNLNAGTLPPERIGPASIPLDRLAIIHAGRLLGRSLPIDGTPEEITLGTNLFMTGSTLNASGGSGSGGITQLTGDVAAGPGTDSQVATIQPNKVTYAKLQDVTAASRLLGRGGAAVGGTPFVTGTSSVAHAGPVTSLTFAHPATGDPLYVSVNLWSAGVTVTTLIYGGVPLTFLGRVTVGNAVHEWWALLSPPAGTANVVITLPAAMYINAAARNVSGANGNLRVGSLASTSSSGTSASLSVTSAAGDLVLDHVGDNTNNQVFTPGAGQTVNFAENSQANTDAKGAGSSKAGAASVSMAWTMAFAPALYPWHLSAISIPPGVIPGGAGDPQEIALGPTLAMNGTTLGVVPAGSNQQVQFNDGGALGATNGLLFDKASGTLAVSNLSLGTLLALVTGQIKFPTTAVPSADLTTLDDYREGLWTPTITCSGGSSGQVYSGQVGYYVKLGKTIFLYGFVGFSTKGTHSGDVYIGGLPVNGTGAGSVWPLFPVVFNGMASAVGGVMAYPFPGGALLQMVYLPAGGSTTSNTPLPSSQLTNATYFIVSGYYFATS